MPVSTLLDCCTVPTSTEEQGGGGEMEHVAALGIFATVFYHVLVCRDTEELISNTDMHIAVHFVL